jgi:hypothetical protein
MEANQKTIPKYKTKVSIIRLPKSKQIRMFIQILDPHNTTQFQIRLSMQIELRKHNNQ